jgi:hypothetical protein
MYRRELLGTVGTGTVGLAGLLGLRARGAGRDTETDETTTSETTTSETATEIGCPPEVVGETFTAFRGACGSADDASVTFADGTVAVSGSIRVPNPCYGARLADVSIPDADTLRVTVAATDPSGGVCVQCVGSVEYAADLRFRDRVPETVEVVHRRDGQSAVVTTATRGESSSDGRTTRGETTTGAGATRDETTGDR